MKRVVVIGTTGSGKSTFARQLAQKIQADWISLDQLSWMPDWQQRSRPEYQILLSEQLEKEAWVVDGNTRESREMLWGMADTVVWLNYSFWVNFNRLFFRTMQRIIRREEVFPGCVETFHSQFLKSDSILVWFFRTFWKRRRMYGEALNSQHYPHLQILIFKHPRQARQFLVSLQK